MANFTANTITEQEAEVKDVAKLQQYLSEFDFASEFDMSVTIEPKLDN